MQKQAQLESNKLSRIRASSEICCLKRPFLSGDGCRLPSHTAVALPGLLESRVYYMQLLTTTDNTICPQLFHYLWNVCWVQSVASRRKWSNNEALPDFWQRHIQTHKNKLKHYRLCIILSWHVSSVTTICSQKTLTSTFFHSEIIWPKVYLIPLLPQKRNSLVKGCLYVCLTYEGFHLQHSCTDWNSPACCRMPGAAVQQQPANVTGGQVLSSQLDTALTLLWSLIFSFYRNSYNACAEQWASSLCLFCAKRWSWCRWGWSAVQNPEHFAEVFFGADLWLESPLGAHSL